MPTGLEEAAAAVAALSVVAEGVEGVAASADIVRAFSPTEGLQVASHVFQSVEQEGHWKKDRDFGDGRQLEPPPPASTESPKSHGLKKSSIGKTQPGQRVLFDPPVPERNYMPLLTIHLKGPALAGVSDVGRILDSSAQVGVWWYSDGLEIWGGFAGLSWATGFGSVFGQRALVELSGTPFGNYFPTRYFLAFSGYLNPVGAAYEDFRGAVSIRAASSTLEPLFCNRSSRPLSPKKSEIADGVFRPFRGYDLELQSGDQGVMAAP
jgi:hypothetical protein